MQQEYQIQRPPLDTFVDIVTPENVTFSYRLAGPILRMTAFLLDIIVFGAVYLGLSMAIAVLDGATSYYFHGVAGFCRMIFGELLPVVVAIASFAAFWLWNALFEAYNNACTPGKFMCGLRVLTVDGLPINLYQALLRNIIRAADIVAGPFTLFVMVANKRFMRPGDIAAGTIVVVARRHDRKQDHIHFERPDIVRMSARIPATFVVSDELARALALYAQRRATLSPARRLAIAMPLVQCLMPLLGVTDCLDPDALLCALYRWHTTRETQTR